MTRKTALNAIVRTIGTFAYGKERWIYQCNDKWYDREKDDYFDTDELVKRVNEELTRVYVEAGEV